MGVELIARMHTLKKMRAVDGHQAAGDVADVIRRTYSTVELLITHSLIWEFTVRVFSIQNFLIGLCIMTISTVNGSAVLMQFNQLLIQLIFNLD